MSPPKIRILHAVPDLEYGGLQRLVAELARWTNPGQFEVQLLVFGGVGPPARSLGSEVPVHRAVAQSAFSMLRPAALARQIREIAPDVLHSHSGVWYKASLAARQAGVSWIVHTDHGRRSPDPWDARLVDYLASRRTDVVVAVSDVLAQHLTERVVAHAERVRVVLNGVDTELHRPRASPDLRAELRIPNGAVVLGSIGRLEPIKGYDTMLEAYAQLRRLRADPDGVVLVVAGDGALRPQLEARARQLGIGAGVRLLGWREDVTRLHATFDLFVLTSRSEGTSVSLLEAMSAGLCPVVTDVGGNREVLGPGLAHRLAPPNDVRAIAESWAEAVQDRERLAQDAAAGRRQVEEHFSLRAMVRGYERIYLEGVGRSDRASPGGAIAGEAKQSQSPGSALE